MVCPVAPGHAGAVTSSLIWDAEPGLHRPLVVVALAGWFDAGEAATGAVEWLRAGHDVERMAVIDSDEHFDFQQQRPEVVIDDEGLREIAWPVTTVERAEVPSDARDLVLVAGVEPHLAWRAFVDDLIEIIEVCDAGLVVTLGAVASGVPHSRAPRVTGSSTDSRLAGALGLTRPSYEGVTGVVGVLHTELDRRDVPAVSLRVSAPHYLGGSPNPRAARSLLEHLQRITGVRTRFSELDEEVGAWVDRVDVAVGMDDDVRAYVNQLEEAYDAEVEALAESTDLAAELERYLKERGD